MYSATGGRKPLSRPPTRHENPVPPSYSLTPNRERVRKAYRRVEAQAVLDHGAPKDQDVDAGILTGGRRIPRHGERRLRRSCTPGLDPGKPAILEFGDDLVGDVVVKVAARATFREVTTLSGHRDDLRDGRRKPLLQPSTRHGKSVRTLTLKGALRGLPAEGGASATPVPTRGKAFPCHLRISAMMNLVVVHCACIV